MYEKTNQVVENWCKRIIALFEKIILPLLILPIAMLSYCTYFTTDLGAASFLLPFPVWWGCWQQLFLFTLTNWTEFRVPFDWKNPIGYFIAFILQAVCAALLIDDASFCMSFTISTFLFGITVAKDVKRNLKKINKSAKTKEHRSLIMGQLTELLDLFSSLKQLRTDSLCTTFSQSHQFPFISFAV